MNVKEYFDNIQIEVKKSFDAAGRAKAVGIDPIAKIEIPIAMSLAEKAVGLISTVYPQLAGCGIVERILALEKEFGQLDATVCFKISEEIARERFCKFESLLQSMDAGIRVAFSYFTLGVVSSPIEGFTELKIKKTKKGEDYIAAYFSGPIRSSGTTASCVVLMIIDYLRETFGFAKYDPEENEVKRYVTENYDYHERVNNLQYLPTEEEIYYLASHIPIEITGEPSEKREVSNYKDLPRVETNAIRGGMCLCFSEGLAQKAQKGFRLYKGAKDKGIKISGWDFLDEFIKKFKEIKKTGGAGDNVPVYIKDLVAGRPVYGHPGRGFRFRYGRSRATGFSATAVHPATMAISNSFLSFGTQLKIEKPTKGCAISCCDSIDGPIVKLRNGSVRKAWDFDEAKKLYKDVEEIIYLGDILVSFGDVLNRNYNLIKPGYVEEWWELQLKKAIAGGCGVNQIPANKYNVGFDEAVDLSRKAGIPLHPSYIFYWKEISFELFLSMLDWLGHGEIKEGKLVLPYTHVDKERFAKSKRALELIGCEHEVTIENVVITEKNTKALLFNLGIEGAAGKMDNLIDMTSKKIIEKGVSVALDAVNCLSSVKIKDKAGTFIGSRMGRPEKAKLRKLIGSPHALFPVGEQGGRLRSLQAANEVGFVNGEFLIFFCESCKRETIYAKCESCGGICKKLKYSRKEGKNFDSDAFWVEDLQDYSKRNLELNHYYEAARKKLGLTNEQVPMVKGVRGTSNADHSCERLEKGFLRAKYNLHVNKDGTIRYDMTEMPLTHFKARELGTSVEKLRSLGYDEDCYGAELVNDDQVIEMMPHDVVLPACVDSGDEPSDDVLLRIMQFVDDELEMIYGMPRFFNVKNKEDVVGQLVVCIAPHICTASVGRVIGFSKTQALLASPFMHAAMRRDCFDYNSYIPLRIDGKMKIVKIGEYVEGIKPDRAVDVWGTTEKRAENVCAVGFDSGMKEIGVNNFTKHAFSRMIKLKSALGKKMVVSENHKFLIDGKEKRASELKIGDKLPLPYKIDIKTNDLREINLLEHLHSEGFMVREIRSILEKEFGREKVFEIANKFGINRRRFDNFHRRDSYPADFVLSLERKVLDKIVSTGKIGYNRDKISLPIIAKMSDKLLEVVGLFIAEGYARSVGGKKGLNQIYISSSERELRDFVASVMKREFGLVPSDKKEDRIVFSSKILYLLFTKILGCGHGAYEKRIPSMFLDLPLENLACVLRGYFEGDGSAEKTRKKVCCDSVSEGLLYDLEFCLARFGIFAKRYEYEKEPGDYVKQFYIKKGRDIPVFKVTKLIIGSDFVDNFKKIGFLSNRKNKILEGYKKMKPYGMKIQYNNQFVFDPIVSLEDAGERESYCLNVDSKEHSVFVNSILSKQCDGDEAAFILLMDVLLNFSKRFLPAHRGGTQDAPLVLNTYIRAGDVDDQILDFETGLYSIELYELAEEGKHSSEVKNIDIVKKRLKDGRDPFTNIGFSHDCSDINHCVTNSSYKSIPSMQEKVDKQMELCGKIRAVDISDVARLIIDRHFIRDTKGNLRKFSMQSFRCVKCNEIYRRPPLTGKCNRNGCGGRLIFTISEGSILKYMQPALNLARTYKVSPYILEDLELTEMYIQSIFGKEKEKQESIAKWF